MLQVSGPALVLLRDALIQERTQDSHVFRLDVRDDEFVLGMDDPQEDDVEYEHDGTTVLVAPNELATNLLSSTTIDLETTAEGPRLVLVS
jgi:Fe-S cluster assembly iron-binding protein IscA